MLQNVCNAGCETCQKRGWRSVPDLTDISRTGWCAGWGLGMGCDWSVLSHSNLSAPAALSLCVSVSPWSLSLWPPLCCCCKLLLSAPVAAPECTSTAAHTSPPPPLHTHSIHHHRRRDASQFLPPLALPPLRVVATARPSFYHHRRRIIGVSRSSPPGPRKSDHLLPTTNVDQLESSKSHAQQQAPRHNTTTPHHPHRTTASLPTSLLSRGPRCALRTPSTLVAGVSPRRRLPSNAHHCPALRARLR